ncbi:MAG: tRNA (N6-threonylcarbamoyladenosine(37)-N6)-methyltransferase TrmO [Neisseriaceae bacterium]|nr:tRNA (N6-threonylcarbamoyladenosine(37)-N6)-methyltransferase TrmO [Neisseriaceae bacterium PsAf]MCV2508851.1 tRNA (N6-threonylcarbamoyladenosine(37)-N6)-methyltransferase TrmO [Neisseriaceae bacterium]
MNSFVIKPIGIATSPYKQKFGIPRQSGIIKEAIIEIVLNERFSIHAIRGIEEFEYIWVQYIFHENIQDGWSELVRPPKLGGKIKKGVFATRSSHRPNFIGLSLLKLEKVELINKKIHLFASGADILDQTPIIDIKPYLAHLEAKKVQQTNFSIFKQPLLPVLWNETEKQKIDDLKTIHLIEKSLSQDPRPAYQNIEHRIYVTIISKYEIHFKVYQKKITIEKVREIRL